jgi:cysteine desulfurase / selenocysteine lyase
MVPVAATHSLDVARLRDEFPILAQRSNGQPLVYLDSAATVQRPRVVVDAVSDFYRSDNANVHRGLYELSARATERFEQAWQRLARFVNADPSEIVWVRGATEAINLVAYSWGLANLGEGDEVVLTMLEHHSNIVPWQIIAERTGAKLRYVDIDEQGRLRLDQLDELLSDRTRLVAVSHVSNALGTINPIGEICRRAAQFGTRVIVDGAQAAPHLPVDVRALGSDFYAISGHKMFGPMGIGVLWARRELLEAMPPFHGGGEMIHEVGLERSTWAQVPHKFEAGTPNVAGAIGLAAAADFLESIGHQAAWAHEQALVRHGMERLRAVDGLTLYGPENPEDRTAVFSFKIDGVHPHDVATILNEHGIAIRAGHHCAQPLMRRLGVPATTRASCHLYNTTDELDRLAEALDSVKRIFGV